MWGDNCVSRLLNAFSQLVQLCVPTLCTDYNRGANWSKLLYGNATAPDWNRGCMVVLKAGFKGRITPRHDSNWNLNLPTVIFDTSSGGVTATWALVRDLNFKASSGP